MVEKPPPILIRRKHMKELYIVVGANNSGKTTFTESLESTTVVLHTDDICDDYSDMSKDDKVDMITSLLDDNDQVVVDGNILFFDKETLEYFCELEDISTHVIIAVYDESVTFDKYTNAGDADYEYLQDDDVRLKESTEMWIELFDELSKYQDLEDVQITMVDVTDYSDWSSVEISTNTSKVSKSDVSSEIKAIENAILNQINGTGGASERTTEIKNKDKKSSATSAKEILTKECPPNKIVSQNTIKIDGKTFLIPVNFDKTNKKTIDGVEYYVVSNEPTQSQNSSTQSQNNSTQSQNSSTVKHISIKKTVERKSVNKETTENDTTDLDELKTQKLELDAAIKQARASGDMTEVNELRKLRRKVRANINKLIKE